MDTTQQHLPGRPSVAGAGGQEGGREAAPNAGLVLGTRAIIGALAIYAPAGRSGPEIEISPVGDHHYRAHNVVRMRRTGPAKSYAAVFPGLPAGEYIVWQDTIQVGTVTVHGGSVTEFNIPASE